RTNIQFKDAEKKTKAVAVTSSSPQEGKTLVAVNLAIAMAQARMKVLLIGSDLRKPAVDKVFDLEMTPGLTDILMENYQWRDTVKTVMDMAMGELTQTQIIRTPGLDNLHVITSGAIPPNPAELIDSTALTDFIEEAREEYDMIIFDSPPILSTADAAILGAKLDGVLLVYRVGSVSKGLLKRSVTQLQQVKSNIMGVILNGMRPEVSPDFQDYKYYSYYYSYGEEGKDKKGRDRKKGLAFLGRKGKKESKDQNTSTEEEGRGAQKQEAKKVSGRRLLLLFVATAILAVGVLWHNGLMDPFKALDSLRPVKKEEKRKQVRTGISKTPVARRPERVAPTAKPAVSKKEDPLEKRNTVIESPAASKPLPHIKAPGPEKKTPEPASPSEKAEGVGARAEPTVTADKAPEKTALVKESVSERSVPKEAASVSTKAESPPLPKTPELTTIASISKSPPPSIGMAPAKTTPVLDKTVSYPYSLYLGSFQNQERAKKAVSFYTEKGVSAYWVKVLLSKGTWYRVYVGYFENGGKAKRFREEKGLNEATVEEVPYANLIGVFTSSEELEDRILYLRNLGYSSYAVKDLGGKFRLYVGAFYPEHRAKRQYNDLKFSGIESQVVKR
ncbi:MAG: polysaccharide biosynthesis tyrosine autokinase, partial [Desulfobacteraceae bacterium]